MRKVLLIKTSSLGDVVHNLPAVSDIHQAIGAADIDWVAEKSFAAIPTLHPGVRRVIPCQLRRWRRTWYTSETREEWRHFRDLVSAEDYDAVIDTQGLLKSALVTRLASGTRYGLDWRSSREPLRWFYDRTFSVPWAMHAVERNRRLCSLALDYAVVDPPEYGLRCGPYTAPWLPRRPYVVLLHATSHPRKLWPESSWLQLADDLFQFGFATVLPWGNDTEHERAERLASQLPDATVPARLELEQVAGVLGSAAAVVGVDTGLTHLAVALGVPTVGIYGATDPQATGVYGSQRAVSLGSKQRFPSVTEVVNALKSLGAMPAVQGARLVS